MILRARRRTRPQRLVRDRWGGSYLPMVLLLVSLILVGPSLSPRGPAAAAFVAFVELSAALLGVLGATDNSKSVRTMIVFSVLAVAVQFVGQRTEIDSVLIVGKLAIVAVLFRVQGLILRDVVPEPSVTVSTIVGAVGTYLLAIVYWATIYSVLTTANPGAFAGPLGSSGSPMDFIYYSSITQTTVGYGDIVPVTSLARSLASLQAISGQLYVAILVAWLVGRAVSERQP